MLRQAYSMSLAIDECKYRKVVRYRANLVKYGGGELGCLWRHVAASGFTHCGVLGILSCEKKRAADFEGDRAVTAVKQLSYFVTKLCAPLGRRSEPQACDEELKSHIMRSVASLAADGAAKERRAIFLAARDLFPNVLIVIRDPARAIRLAIQSLHCDDVFGEVRRELFDGRRALAAYIRAAASGRIFPTPFKMTASRLWRCPALLASP